MVHDKSTQSNANQPSVHRSTILWVVALTVLAGCLLMPRLGQRHLWEDEAVTALLAQNTLRFGAPTNWDGAYLISFAQISANENFLEVRTPWLPYYLLAGVYRLLGTWSQESTWIARLPFAVCALACVPSYCKWFNALRAIAALQSSLLLS